MTTDSNHERRFPATAENMPEYECHKHVWALKITDVTVDEEHGRALLHFDKPEFEPLGVSETWLARNVSARDKGIFGLVGGYYVVYRDGFASWSPGDVFEDGYQLWSPGGAAAPQ